MKTLILYTTKHGATKKIAEMIGERLPDTVTYDLIQHKDAIPPLSDFDCVILGSQIMAGQIQKEVKEFADKNSSTLQRMKLGLFVSGMDGKQESQYFETNFSSELCNSANSMRFLGGIFDPGKCGFMERTMMKVIAKLSVYTSTIEPEKIDLFVEELTR